MAELEVDQSHLPRVQEVCQCFAVLEDGVLAHSLQEQEIEHYYTSNIQKNQLVQNDIRMAKRLQDEEDEQRAQQRALLRQASRQLEEQDSEYARVIQDELQRCAEEACKREQEDEEMAKKIQEEEEQRLRRRSRGQDSLSDGSTSGPALPSSHHQTLSSPHQGEGQPSIYPTTATRWQCATSYSHSDFSGPQAESPKGEAAQRNTTPWSNEGHADSIRQIRNELREPLSEDSEDSDTVFSEQLSVWPQRLDERLNTAPCRRRASLHQPQERNYRSLHSHSSFREESHRCWAQDRGEWDEDYEYEYLKERRPRNREWQSNHREEYEDWHRNRNHERDSGLREKRCSRSQSVQLRNRDRHSDRDAARNWSYRDNPDKHVHFQDDPRRCNDSSADSSRVWEMLGQVLRERGVAVRHGIQGAPLQVRPQSRDSQVLYGSEASYGDGQAHQGVFQRAASTRRSYHGDIRERRRLSNGEISERDYRGGPERHHDSPANVENDGVEVNDERSRYSGLANRERGGSRRWRGVRSTQDNDRREEDVNHDHDGRSRRSRSQRWHRHKETEEKLSSEEEVERRVEQPRRRVPQRNQSLSSTGAATRDRSRHATAGAELQLEPEGAYLDMGELRQVLQDEELARRLQEEEDRLLRRSPQPSPHTSYPEGDFRVAQVAQDEEIARFMQKQEIKSKRRSRELEGPASWREHREMISHHDRRAARERQVQRERLDSEGLPSPTEDFSLENQPPSPFSTIPQAQQIRNIAEELDPTFKARRQGSESLRVAQTGPACQSLPSPHSGLHDLLEEPTFIPPTKRQCDKSGRGKPKEKKENCKQQ